VSAASLVLESAQSQARFRRLVGAELLKLRRRRALVAASLVLIVAPMVVSYVVLATLHAANAAKYGPAGGVENLRGALELLTQIGAVAAVLIGVNAGAGDLGAGVFRELVVTGRSRFAVFAARIPGGLALLLPLVAVACAIAAMASVALAASGQAPGAALLLEYTAWVGLVLTVGFLLAWASLRCSAPGRPRSASSLPGSSPSPRSCCRAEGSTPCSSGPRSGASNRAARASRSRL
jgi:hypothetical protein